MSATDNQLLIPPDAHSDPKSVEMVRAWIVDGGLQCSLRMGVWDDVRAWGILLADLLRHVAEAKEKEDGTDRSHCIEQMRKTFDAELDAPTSETEGEYV